MVLCLITFKNKVLFISFMKIIFVAAARPNFPKVAPLLRSVNKISGVHSLLVHTGQHFDDAMSKSFFDALDIPDPDVNFGVGGGSHAENTAKTMIAFENYLKKHNPDLIVVVGDVDATMSCAIVAKKCNIPLAHIEAGLRSFDLSMPEEVNRIIVDRIADYLFVHEQSGIENLQKEGVSNDKIFFIGNVMIDSLIYALPKIKESKIKKKLGLSGDYALVTMHRPATVDDKGRLVSFLDFLQRVSETITVVWPLHPRTKKNLEKFNIFHRLESIHGILLTASLHYPDFMNLVLGSKVVLTDSGGIQEETSYLGIPCLTFRKNTERPVTIELGTNELVGYDYSRAQKAIASILSGNWKKPKKIPFWDGKAANRFAEWVHYYELH